MKSFGMLLGRFALCLVFILSGVNKVMHWDETIQFMASKGMTMIPLFLLLSILLEVFGGVFLLFGFRTRITATLLLLYLIPVTAIFHNFWSADEASKQLQTIMFLKNVAIFGGLVYVATLGAGMLSVDREPICKPGNSNKD